MRICGIRLKTCKPLSPLYSEALTTWGDHVRKRRLDLGLRQKEVAKIIGVSASMITNWEVHRTEPAFCHFPKIIAFLGYVPETEAKTLGERIIAARKLRGMSQKALAKELGVDPGTLAKWERDERGPGQKLVETLNRWFVAHPSDAVRQG